MVIDRSKHNKFVGLPEKTTDTRSTTGASSSGSGDGSTTVIIGGGGGTASLDPELIEELRNQEAFSYINISDGQNTILTSAQIEKDYFNLAIQGDGETSETQVSSDKYLPRTQIQATGSIPGSYWVVFDHVQVPDIGPDEEPVYKDIWRIELTKMSPDPVVRPNIDYNGIELIYQGASQGVYNLSDDRVSVQSTSSGDTLTITINQDDYTDFDTIQLVWTQDANHTPVTTLSGIAIQNYVTVTITQAGATRFWKLDEYGNLYTDYNAYSNLNLGAKGRLWTNTGLYVGNFTQGISGGVFYVQNEQGDTYIEADRMRIRKKAYFETLEIVNVNSVGGKQIISPAGAVTLRKVEEITVTDADGTETPVYRCYFMGEQDGVEVENRWHIGDQAFSQNFNIRTPGEYEQVANHYFWRLVVGLSTELDEDGNYYIDLSVTDCDTDSDIPHANDVVAQLGNRTDVDRQSALIFSSVDAESPRIILCHGIDSYTLSNTEYFDVGVNHAENRAYMNVYGDTYIGDRNNIDESKGYVYYDSSTQTLNIRASISASSTIGDKPFSEVFVTAESFEDMTNAVLGPQLEYIQNQIDGTIEAYFYDYSPTLENEPALTWINEGKQNEHLGDTFTNIQTYISDEETPDAGKSWRWVLKDGVYSWEPIADSDAVAALKKAAEAQDTADGKRRVFVTQPTQEQAYDIGDLWVNATYSDGRVTYENDILRANTAKQAGYPFSISHWGQASAYRELYDSAMQKAQAAADAADDVQTAVDEFKTDIDETFQDGVITTSEASRLRTLIDTINTTVYNARQTFNDIYNDSHLEGTTEKSNLQTAYNAFIADTDDDPNTITPRIVAIIEELLAKVGNTQTPYQITKGDISSINQEYAIFNDNYEDYIVALNAANLKITSQIAATAEASAVARYAYLENLFSGKTTIEGAVITTGMMVVGTENAATGEYIVNGGFSGVINDAELGDGMAIWYGGDKIDAETSTDHNDRIAGSLLRYDGSGYFGARWVQDSTGKWNKEYGIRWNKDGIVTVDPATFWVGEAKVDLLLQVFNAIDSEPSDGYTDEIEMLVPFREVLVGDAYIGYDAVNNSVYVYRYDEATGTRKTCNFYATGEVSAYGSPYEDESPVYARYVRDLRDVNYGGNVDPDSADTLLMWNGTTWAYINKNDVGLNEEQLEQYLTENEYAKKSDIITSISWSAVTGKPSWIGDTKPSYSWNEISNKPSSFTPSSHTHTKSQITDFPTTWAWTNISGKPTTLSGYGITDGVNSITLTGSGNAVTSASINGHVVTLTKGSTFSLSTHNHDSVYVNVTGDTMSGTLTLPTIVVNTRIQLGNAYIEYDSTNNAVVIKNKTTNGVINFYATGEVSAYGFGDGTNPSGVMYLSELKDVKLTSIAENDMLVWNGSVWVNTPMADITPELSVGNITDLNASWRTLLKSAPSAYVTRWPSISEVTNKQNLVVKLNSGTTEGTNMFTYNVTAAKTINITPSAIGAAAKSHNHSWANITSGKPTTLAGYGITDGVNAVSVTGSGNAITAASISSHTLTLTKGSTFLLSSAYTAADILAKLKTVDGSGSGLDADTLDGLQNGYVTANKLYTYGTAKDVNTINGNCIYRISNSSLNAPYAYGALFQFSSVNEPVAGTSGHWVNQLMYGTNETIYVRQRINADDWKSWKIIAFTDSNVASATKLRTPRTIWGQSFDGTGNVDGNLILKSSSYPNIDLTSTNSTEASIYYRSTSVTQWAAGLGCWVTDNFTIGTMNSGPKLSIDPNGNVGIGTTAPSHKLYVAGNTHTSGSLSAGSYVYSQSGWFQNNKSGCGLYNSAHDARWYANSNGWYSDKAATFAGRTTHKGGISAGYSNTGYRISTDSFICNSAVRTNGNSGWYSETHGGGIYMDNATYVKLYNQKTLYLSSKHQTGASSFNTSLVLERAGNVGMELLSEGTCFGIGAHKNKTIYFWYGTGASQDSSSNKSYKLTFNGSTWNFTGTIVATSEITAYSDMRLKSDIKDLVYRGRLNPKSYIKDNKQSIGFIAQEVQELYPELVMETGGDNNYLALNYGNITAVLSAQINNVEDEVTALKKRVKELEDKLSKYEHV